MGPEATVLFLEKVIDLTPARKDQDHIPMIIYNYPQIPDRTRAILLQGPSPVAAIRAGIQRLKDAGVDFICIPCNTAHYFFDEFAKDANIPVLNLIDCVVEYTRQQLPGMSNIGLLATEGTMKAGIYGKAFARHQIDVLLPSGKEQNALQQAIYQIKNRSKDYRQIQFIADNLVAAGSQAIILGCTELSLIARELQLQAPILDSTEILAKTVVAMAWK